MIYCMVKAFSATNSLNTSINLNYTYSVRTAQSTHTVSVIKISQLMLYCEIIAVCSQIHTKHINTLCGQNVEFASVKPGGK
jgi:hypothetical protein